VDGGEGGGVGGINRLGSERSSYLLQHKDNPVHWYPWGQRAFDDAKRLNKLIFLSVGYSTCHWCHVMERESFESQEVADIMNEHFINVKVDREERPDVDKVYMSFVQASTGSGGWPMSVFLTPTLRPVFGGTYFPPEDQMFGRPGFKTLLKSLASQWDSKRDRLNEAGDRIIGAMEAAKGTSEDGDGQLRLGQDTVKKCFSQLVKSYDPNMGGFSRAPKFPQPVNFNFLLRMSADSTSDADHSKQAVKMVLHTLDKMSEGGIFDHVSKGFARYSTDARWHVPHFEKMLYDQAQLCVAYAQAFQVSKDEKYKRVVNDIVEYVSRDLTHPEGGFYCAEDADSFPERDEEADGHKKEGAFCVWTHEEIAELLPGQTNGGKKKADVFGAVFGVKPGGNVDPRGDPHGELKGQNVLTRIDCDAEKVVADFGLESEAELEAIVAECCQILHRKRQSRPRPHLDDKILTSWNGLMISGLCAAADATGEAKHLELAVKAMEFIKTHMWQAEKKVLYRSAYRGKEDGNIHQLDPPIAGFVDDYANTIRALIDLYQSTFKASYLEWAQELQLIQNEIFWDAGGKGYFTSAAGDASIVVRMKEDQDGAEPSPNSVSAHNLIRLHHLIPGGAGNNDFMALATQTVAAYQDILGRFPVALPEMASALMSLTHSPPTIIVTGDPQKSAETRAMIKAIHGILLPHKILVLADGNRDSIVYKNSDVLKDIPANDSAGCKAFLCQDFACSPPVTNPEELVKMLLKKK